MEITETLKSSAVSVEEALHAYRNNANSWERAHDYSEPTPALNNLEHNDPEIQLRFAQPLPQTFIEEYNKVQYKSFMGLFPQIDRAWLTVDTKLFLWAYSTPSHQPHSQHYVASNDFYVYEGMSQVIVSVALVNPQPDVFVDSVKYLIAVATTVEVTLLGVLFTSGGELTLVPTQISIPTDNVLMLKIVSTPKGKIFMAGADGILYEFVYQNQEKTTMLELLSGKKPRRAKKIAHKSSLTFMNSLVPSSLRSYLSKYDELVDIAVQEDNVFTLSQSGILSLYDVSHDVRLISSVDVSKEAKQFVEFGLSPVQREFVSIHTIPPKSMNSVHLIVSTSVGERIYFSIFGSQSPRFVNGSAINSMETNRLKTLRCVGYRPYPSRQLSGAQAPCIHIAMCESGFTIFADLRQDQSDRLIAIFADSEHPSSPTIIKETSSTTQTTEIVFETSLDSYHNGEMKVPAKNFLSSNLDSAIIQREESSLRQDLSSRTITRTFGIVSASRGSSLLYEQGNAIPRDGYFNLASDNNSFWLLTSTSICLFERTLPIQKLARVLSLGDLNTESISFCKQYGFAETCAMCLEIATNVPALSSVAARLFYRCGSRNFEAHNNDKYRFRGSPEKRRTRIPGTVQSNMFTTAQEFQIGRPSLQTDLTLSSLGSFNGACLFVAKILHPIWNAFITNDRDPMAFQTVNINLSTVKMTQSQLRSFVAFLNAYPPKEMLLEAFQDQQYQPGLNSKNEWNQVKHLPNEVADRSNRTVSALPPGVENISDEFETRKTISDREEMKRIESASLAALGDFSTRAEEALSLLLIISDHQLNRLISGIPPQSRNFLCKLRFKDLVVTQEGHRIAAALIDVIVRSYSDSDSAANGIVHLLQEECSSYFNDRDVHLHRALANLRTAKEEYHSLSEQMKITSDYSDEIHSTQHDRIENLIDEATSILKSVPDRVYDVTSVCKEFEEIEAHSSLVEVALAVGADAEKHGNTSRADVAYDLIVDAISFLSTKKSLFTRDSDDGNATHSYAATSVRPAVRLAMRANSERFLWKLYSFLSSFEIGIEILLDQPCPSLEKFLEKNGLLDLLWKYCTKHNRNYEAAIILLNLGESNNQKTLMERLNLLTCAFHNAKVAIRKGEKRGDLLLKEIGDFLDVARVQIHAKEEISRLYRESELAENAISELDSELMNLTTLLNQYARPLKLYETTLFIFRSGSYHNKSHVELLWMNIVTREMKKFETPVLLAQRIQSICRQFYPNETIFPIAVLVNVLECVAYKQSQTKEWGDSSGWASSILMNVGVPLSDLIDGYYDIVQTPSRNEESETFITTWGNEIAQLYLLEASENVIRRWVMERVRRNGSNVDNRMIFSDCDKMLRTISLCKSKLRSMSHENSLQLLDIFDELELQLINTSK